MRFLSSLNLTIFNPRRRAQLRRERTVKSISRRKKAFMKLIKAPLSLSAYRALSF